MYSVTSSGNVSKELVLELIQYLCGVCASFVTEGDEYNN